MLANHHFTRIDTLDLKNLIFVKVGHQRAEKYFDHLKGFFAFKLSKSEFNKCCLRTIGRENISLHNKLIKSILRNSCRAKIPPQESQKPKGLNYQKKYTQSLQRDAFPQSPRKCRSPINRDRKFRDRTSPLGPLGKSPSITCEETFTLNQEKQQCTTELQSVGSRPFVIEEGEEVEQLNENCVPITAPVGVSFSPVGARTKGLLHTFEDLGRTCEGTGELPDLRSLMGRLEKKLAAEGVGVSLEYADLLNNGLNVFLKRLIEPCLGIARSRCRDDSRVFERQCNDNRMMSPVTFAGRSNRSTDVGIFDFRIAMESNNRLLGEDSSVQLEKICHYASS